MADRCTCRDECLKQEDVLFAFQINNCVFTVNKKMSSAGMTWLTCFSYMFCQIWNFGRWIILAELLVFSFLGFYWGEKKRENINQGFPSHAKWQMPKWGRHLLASRCASNPQRKCGVVLEKHKNVFSFCFNLNLQKGRRRTREITLEQLFCFCFELTQFLFLTVQISL